MPGMGSGLSANNSTIVSAFRTALLHQGLIVLAILAIVVLTWNLIRANQIRALSKAAAADGPRPLPATDALPAIGPEPAVRRLLRIGFGLIWVLDGLLQAQSAMPLGMIPQVVQPTAQASPAWVQHLVNAGGTIWNNHPIEAAAAAVWIQLGIGLWLLIAPRGLWSRLGGVASVFWGVLVWIFGESFGGIFAPGASWLFGTPGAVLFYCAAGVIVALPDRSFTSARLGRVVLGVMGTFFIGMAVLEAWPGRGFWQGASHGRTVGTLTSMVQSMVTTPQPKVISSSLNAFASFDAAHGFAVNLFVVVALGAIGLAFLSGRPAVVRLGVGAAAVVCLADWVLVQDFGFLGGVGTDPNSMVPMLLVIVGGYLALVKPLPVVAEAAAERRVEALGAIEALRRRATAQPAFLLRALAALGAIGVVTVGALPMALASVNPNADPIVAEAIDGSPNALNTPGTRVPPGGSARPAGQPRGPAQQDGRPHVPRPRLHERLPDNRSGVPPGGRVARCRLATRRLHRGRGQPALPLGLGDSGLRPGRGHVPAGELALPDGIGRPVAADLERVRGPGVGRVGRRDDRPL